MIYLLLSVYSLACLGLILACCAGAILTPGYQQAEKTKPALGMPEASEVLNKHKMLR
jgi:hypothetical protein